MTLHIDGLRVGHWTDGEARTGCSVVLLPEGTTASGEVRGGAPATREFALLEPTRTVSTVDAVVLSGGSAFGLAAAEGVMTALEAAGRGVPTAFGRVPIVVGMSLFDLGVGDPSVRPGPDEGRLATEAALAAEPGTGPGGAVGAGTGATVDKWSGHPRPGGLGVATVTGPASSGGRPPIVSAVIAVNAFGAIDPGGRPEDPGPPAAPSILANQARANTTIGVVVTNAVASKGECRLMAESGHDGLARAVLPAHTAVDGDALVVAATGQVDADPMHLRVLVQAAVVEAVRSL
jgi:L-aminopeptidase/D-esterase-like protein